LKIPTLNQAEALLSEAEALNPGPWVEHSIYVAKAASAIAKRHPNLDSDTAFIFGPFVKSMAIQTLRVSV